MLKTDVNLTKKIPINREKAAIIAKTASKYTCTLTLECDTIVLNLKSLIGLLSQSIPKDGRMVLVADGVDEKEATDDIIESINSLL